MKTTNMYSIGKSIISSYMIVEDWWKVDDYDFYELRKAFGIEALKKGVDKSLERGEVVPEKVLSCFVEGE